MSIRSRTSVSSSSSIPSVFLIFDSSSKDKNDKTDAWISSFKKYTMRIVATTWEETVPRVKIAVLDTGIDGTHPYVERQWKRPSHRRSGDTLKDGGYAEVLDDSPPKQEPQDVCGHGTHVAGIILQLAPHVELYIARVFRNSSLTSDTGAAKRVAKAIHHATNIWDADVISMSFGFERYSHEIHEAIIYAYEKGVVMVAAASNDGTNPIIPIAYPARQLGLILCINSADPWGNKSTFNPPPAAHRDNFSILGESVLSIWPEHIPGPTLTQNADQDHVGSWRRLSGTSVATPIAAAVAASLLYSARISRDHLVKSFNGMRQLFTRMTLDKNFSTVGGLENIRPWGVLNYDNSKHEDNISGKFSEELKKI